MHTKVNMAGQGKLKCHDGSEVNARATKTSVKGSLPLLHIRGRNNRCILLQRYTCKPVLLEHEVRGLHMITLHGILALYSQNASETISEGLKSNIFLEGHAPRHPVWARYARIYALRVLMETPPMNFYLHPWDG